jgi:RNA polymerase sigma factor (sigma-70 family)
LREHGHPDPAIDVEDLIQDTWIQIYRALPKFQGTTAQQFFAWISVIARNITLDSLRKAHRRGMPKENIRHAQAEPENENDPWSTVIDPLGQEPPDIVSTQEDRQRIREAIERYLSRKSGRFTEVVDGYLQGLSYQDIATRTRIKPGAVRVMIFRFMRAVAEELRERK